MSLPITPTFSTINGTGQVTVPATATAWSFSVLSGSLVIGTQAPLIAPYSYTSYGRPVQALSFSTTGVGHKSVVAWEAPWVPAA